MKSITIFNSIGAVLTVIILLQACNEHSAPAPPPGNHGALVVIKVELSDQSKYKFEATVATPDDHSWNNAHSSHSAGYVIYTNEPLIVGQILLGDHTPPDAPDSSKTAPVRDTISGPGGKVYHVGDTISNQKKL